LELNSAIIATFNAIDSLQVRWIPREMNKMADKLAKEARKMTNRDLV
jgi:ribonuclease HI